MTADRELETALRGWLLIDDKAKTGASFLMTSEEWEFNTPVAICWWEPHLGQFMSDTLNLVHPEDQPTHYREIPRTPDWDVVSPEAEPEDAP